MLLVIHIIYNKKRMTLLTKNHSLSNSNVKKVFK